MDKAKKSKKQRKVGRNAVYCLRYATEHRREQNQLKRLLKHLKKHPTDACALKAVEHCRTFVRQ